MKFFLQLLNHTADPIVTLCPLNPKKLPQVPYFSSLRVDGSKSSPSEPRPAEAGSWFKSVSGSSGKQLYDIITARIRAEAERVGEVRDLGEQEPWAQAGLDSLSMVELRNALQRELGDAVTLSSTALLDYPCLEALALHIEAALWPAPVQGRDGPIEGEEVLDEWTHSCRRKEYDAAYESALDVLTPSGRTEEDLLVCLQQGKPGCPAIVILYGSAGLPAGSQLVEHFGAQQPIYATQAPEYASLPYFYSSFAERAKDHASTLQSKFGAAGMHLVGYSLGGNLAYEITKELVCAGVQCSLTLIEPAPISSLFGSESDVERRTFVFRMLSEAFKTRAPQLARYELARVGMLQNAADNRSLDREIARIAKTEREARLVQAMSRVSSRLVRMHFEHAPELAPSVLPPAAMFVLDEGISFDAWGEADWNADGLFGWSKAFTSLRRLDGVGEHSVFFSHSSNVRALAEHIKELAQRDQSN